MALAPAAVGAALVGALALYGALRLRALEAEIARAPHVTAGIAQADIARYGELARAVGSFDAVARILETHFALSHAALAQGPLDLLIWPETVYPTTFGAPKSPDGESFDRALGAFVGRTGIPLVFGAYDAEDGREYNAAVLLEPEVEGQVRFATYRKAALFPLTERVPAWLDAKPVRAVLPWLGSWSPGGGARSLPLELGGRSVRVAPLICYDALEPDLRPRSGARGRGADRHALERRLVRVRRGAPPPPRDGRVPQPRDAPRAAPRHADGNLRRHLSDRRDHRAAPRARARRRWSRPCRCSRARPPLFARFGDWLGPAAALAALAMSIHAARIR